VGLPKATPLWGIPIGALPLWIYRDIESNTFVYKRDELIFKKLIDKYEMWRD